MTFYVLGAAIPNATISNRLVSLYASGATPGLPKGMACRESSYHQFVQAYMMGATGLWPNGSNLGTLDQFVGLMQVPNNMSSAFDWYTNTSTGLSIFGSKLAAYSLTCPGFERSTLAFLISLGASTKIIS